MDKKREIDQLMHEYLNFYQHDKQDIPIKNVNDFDQLMHQYKSKFDKQIAIEQKAIQEKEKQRVLQKKLEQTKKNTPKKTITKPPPKTKSFRNKYNHNNDRSNHLKTVIFTIVMLIIIAVVTITTTDFDDNHFSEFNSGISQGEEISQDNLLSYFNISDAILIEANELPVMDNIPDSKNFTRAAQYLVYSDKEPFEDIIIETDNNGSYFTNNSKYYVYLELDYGNTNLFLAPNALKYVSLEDELYITNVCFYDFDYPKPTLGTYMNISLDMFIEDKYFNEAKVNEAMQYLYLQQSLTDHPATEIVEIKNRILNAGYYGLLDYENEQILYYYSDEIITSITADEIKNHPENDLITITIKDNMK